MSYNNDKDNLFSIPGNDIIFLTEDIQHNIWIGTDRGLARYDRSKDRFMRITFAGLPLHVHSSVVTDNGVLFFGTEQLSCILMLIIGYVFICEWTGKSYLCLHACLHI